MLHTIQELEEQFRLCIAGETLRDRSEAYTRLKEMIVTLNHTIEERMDNALQSHTHSDFFTTYMEFTYYFNEMTKASGDLVNYYENNARTALGQLSVLAEKYRI